MFRGKHQDPPSAVSIFISDQFDIPADHLFDAKNLFKSGNIDNTEIVHCTNSEYEALLEINAHALYIVSGARGMYLLNSADRKDSIKPAAQKDISALTALTIKGLDLLSETDTEESYYIYKNNKIIKLAQMENRLRDKYFDKSYFYPESKNKDDQVELMQAFHEEMTGERLEFNNYNQVPYKMITIQPRGSKNYIIGEPPFETLKNAFSQALTEEMNVKAGPKDGWVYCDVNDSLNFEHTVSKLIFLYLFKKGSNVSVCHMELADAVNHWEDESFLINTLMKFKDVLHHFKLEISTVMDFEKVIHIKLYKNDHFIMETFSSHFKATVSEFFKYIIATEIQNNNMNEHLNAVQWSGIHSSQHHDASMEQLFPISFQSEDLLNELNLNLHRTYWSFNKKLEGTGINMAKLSLEEI